MSASRCEQWRTESPLVTLFAMEEEPEARQTALGSMDCPGKLRIAGPEEAGEVACLLDAFNTEYDDPTPGVQALTERCQDLLLEGAMTVVLAQELGTGLAVLRFRRSLWETSRTARDAYLEELYVVPERRGQGVGRALLERAMEVARGLGAVRIELATSTDDRAAIALYESTGFTNRERPEGPSMLVYERDPLTRGAGGSPPMTAC